MILTFGTKITIKVTVVQNVCIAEVNTKETAVSVASARLTPTPIALKRITL